MELVSMWQEKSIVIKQNKRTRMKNQYDLKMIYPEELTEMHFIDDMFDSAIIGVTHDWRVMYSSEKCIDIIRDEISKNKGDEILDEDVMSEAIQCFDFNYGCAYWENCPVYMWTLKEIKDVSIY
jgi:hypothetical protein